MTKGTIALTALGLGAGIMYLADPQDGRRRRARVRDAAAHTVRILEAEAGATSRDARHRFAGLAARILATLVERPAPADDVLAARVHSRVGRLVSHPGAIDVKAAAGVITLSGHVFESELEQLLKGIREVPGVTGIESQLESHAEAGHIPALQGVGPLKIQAVPGWIRWTPTTRVMAGAAGLALMVVASRHRMACGTPSHV